MTDLQVDIESTFKIEITEGFAVEKVIRYDDCVTCDLQLVAIKRNFSDDTVAIILCWLKLHCEFESVKSRTDDKLVIEFGHAFASNLYAPICDFIKSLDLTEYEH